MNHFQKSKVEYFLNEKVSKEFRARFQKLRTLDPNFSLTNLNEFLLTYLFMLHPQTDESFSFEID